jgi:hypothetical protein
LYPHPSRAGRCPGLFGASIERIGMTGTMIAQGRAQALPFVFKNVLFITPNIFVKSGNRDKNCKEDHETF